ncbi:right-handed parallel beta-helix repeat-containing protein, partial [Parapedobacter sp. 10938]|uniref:right-handed parallel beta-helix repeat-containing protein n=1 Tax=Parapedobacter flavus TaxID=3110225 RepID=UPI002DBDD763
MQRFIWFSGLMFRGLLLLGCPPSVLQAQTTRYVSPDGVGDGSTWAQSSSLADAVTNASSNDQLWLKAGIYEIDQTVEFSYSHSGIHVYGGFDGTETNLDQRNVESNETIWDGLGERRILRIGANDIMLDGLTYRNGFVEGDNDGGGAIYISASGTTIQHCTFRENIGAGGRGSGAIYYRNGNGLLIDHCLFENNRTQTYPGDANGGGAIFSWASDMVISHTVFRNNASHNDGGAIYSWDSMALSDCVFEGNQAEKTGGAIRIHTSSTAVIRNVVFSNNHANEDGGAICVGSSAEATIINSLFDANTAGDQAGAIYNTAGLKVTNTTFVNNQHQAIVFRSFSGDDDCFTYIYNSIFYGNTSPEGTSPDISPLIDSYTSVDVELRRNILQVDPHPLYTVGGNLVAADPVFVDPLNADFRFLPASPAIDAGRAMLFNGVSATNAGASTDLEGNPRVQGANIDMGAYEAEPPDIPECTTVNTPVDGAVDVPLDAEIRWEAVDDATGYRVTIGTEAGGTDVIDGQEVSGTAFVLPDGFAENIAYYVTVVPYNSAGEASDCAGISFTTETLPVPPVCATITGPMDGAMDVPLDAEITWEAVDDATGYRIFIGTSAGGTDVVDGQEVSGTVFGLPDGFAENTAYYVTVVPYNSAGEASDCTGVSFTTETLPVPPGCTTITGPVDGATDVPLDAEITWEAVNDATGYRISIGTSVGGTDVVDGEDVSNTAFVLPDGFLENATYYVTVVPYNSAGEATDCAEISFTTETLVVPPVCTTITGPVDGATDVPLDAEITWEAVDDATGYRITIGTEPGGTDVVDGQEVGGTAFSLPDGFAENTAYYITVIPY